MISPKKHHLPKIWAQHQCCPSTLQLSTPLCLWSIFSNTWWHSGIAASHVNISVSPGSRPALWPRPASPTARTARIKAPGDRRNTKTARPSGVLHVVSMKQQSGEGAVGFERGVVQDQEAPHHLHHFFLIRLVSQLALFRVTWCIEGSLWQSRPILLARAAIPSFRPRKRRHEHASSSLETRSY